MNLTRQSSIELAEQVAAGVSDEEAVEVAVCPPSVYLQSVSQVVAETPVGLGSQNIYHESEGAYTGEISAAMIQDVGCRYVILGHSERRNILGESNEAVNLKLKASLQAGLTPIVCLGELLQEREEGRTLSVIEGQFAGSFADLNADQISRCVIAYEPVWAIGTGRVATPDQAEEVHAELRRIVGERFGDEVATTIRIQYGGSVKPDNAADLMSQPNIDGALVGGASLKPESFLAIVEASQQTHRA